MVSGAALWALIVSVLRWSSILVRDEEANGSPMYQQVLRRVVSLLGEIGSSSVRPIANELPILAAGSDGGLLVAPSIVWAGPDDCEKTEGTQKAKKLGPVCRAPDLRKKPIPPYVYGYCKEPEPELPMSCPPRSTKKRKGPCCLNEQKQAGGGCRGS